MTKADKIGWAVHGIAIGLTALYAVVTTVTNPKLTGLDGSQLILTAFVVAAAPVYILALMYVAWSLKRRPPRRFLVGVISFFVTVVVFMVMGDRLQDSFTAGMSWWAIIIVSVLLMKPELEYLMMRGADLEGNGVG